ncbi:class I SAM-dependent methyltransferase [Patescibacteria group bacterium]|nr:class I SAM-dependent methyltransferase [Patescibacteria group bacterium]
MKDHYDSFYKKSSEKFKKYEFHGHGKLVTGEKPNFFEYLKKFGNKNFKVLDLGCGSGELTLKLSPFFKEIVGIDPFDDYIKSAENLKRAIKVGNVIFKVADGKNLPFEDDYFDIVFSSRGPLSANIDFIRESFRVLKKGGLMIEETIGEKDKIELKKIFGRGQNYPNSETKLESVKELLAQSGMKLVESKYFKFYQAYSSINDVVEILERAPIIPDFDKTKDKAHLEEIDRKLNGSGIKLSSHRLFWVAEK